MLDRKPVWLRPQGRRDEPHHMTLRQASQLSIRAQIAIRIALMLAMLVLIVTVHWLERESLKDNHDGTVSFTDVIYFTMISATTTGYGDIVPITDRARMFDALIVTPIRIFFVLLLAGTAYTFVIKRIWYKWRMRRLQATLCNHIIVTGFGTSGSQAVGELIARGTPTSSIVVIDNDPDNIEAAEDLGCLVLEGDSTRDATLQAVQIADASSMIISAGRDDTSILICLTARALAPKLPISVVVRNADNEQPARLAGATTVINPVSFAGLLLAGSAYHAGTADYLADLASADGRVQLAERGIRPEEEGRPLIAITTGLGVRIVREGQPIGFWEPAASALMKGDRIIEIIATVPTEA